MWRFKNAACRRWPQPSRREVCSQPSPSALLSSPVAIWPPTWLRQEREQADTGLTVLCSNTWCSWSRAQHRAPWWQVWTATQGLFKLAVIRVESPSATNNIIIKSLFSWHFLSTQKRDVWPWYAVALLTLTGVHSSAQTNELLSYISVRYHTVTWSHCSPFSHQLIHWLPHCCYFQPGGRSEWAMTHIRTHACVCLRTKTCRQGHAHAHTRARSRAWSFTAQMQQIAVKTREPCFQLDHIQVTQCSVSYQLALPPDALLPCVLSASAGFLEAI